MGCISRLKSRVLARIFINDGVAISNSSVFYCVFDYFFLLSCVSNVIVIPNVVPIIKLAMPIISDVVSAMDTVPFC